MMTHSALVHWLPAQERGKREFPATLRYVGISRFPEDGEGWPDGAWSVELRFTEPPAEQRSDVCEAQTRFLFETAPQERLHPGARFSLYEGPYRVAEVEVLD
jgi:hypothetical protein